MKFKILMVNSTLAMDLVVQPDIKTVQELRGKRIAVDSIGVFSHTPAEEVSAATESILRRDVHRNGVNATCCVWRAPVRTVHATMLESA